MESDFGMRHLCNNCERACPGDAIRKIKNDNIVGLSFRPCPGMPPTKRGGFSFLETLASGDKDWATPVQKLLRRYKLYFREIKQEPGFILKPMKSGGVMK